MTFEELDNLKVQFRICQAEGLIGLNVDQAYEKLKSKYTDDRKIAEGINAWKLVTNDTVFKAILPEISSIDLSNTNIMDIYLEKKRQLESSKEVSAEPTEEAKAASPVETSNEEQTAPAVSTPVEPAPAVEKVAASAEVSAPVVAPVEPTINKIQENELKVANTEAVMGNTTIIPDVKIPADVSVTPEPKKENSNTKTLQKTKEKEVITTRGYANIVLMSIIVIIIVAIICVFIFM